MNDKTKPSKPAKGWTAVKQYTKDWNTTQFMELLKDFYNLSAENRGFLDARVQLKSGDSAALETYRERIIEPFFPKRGIGKLKLAAARKAIRDYTKATGDVAGTAELLMTYVESGAEFTHEYGDIDERFYDSIESALQELANLLKKTGWDLYTEFSERLTDVDRLTDGIGWGFGDYVGGMVAELADKANYCSIGSAIPKAEETSQIDSEN